MPGPLDWIGGTPLVRRVDVAPGGTNPNGAPVTMTATTDDPLTAAQRKRREYEAQREMEELEEEMREDREVRKLQRQKRRDDLLRALEGPTPSPAGEDYAVRGLVTTLQDEIRDLRNGLQRAQSEVVDSRQQAALAELRTRLDVLTSQATHPNGNADAISQLVNGFRQMREVRTEIDHVLPSPPVIDPGLSHAQRIEQERIQAEARIREMELDARLEEIRASRESAAEDRANQRHRIDQVSSVAKDALGPVLEQVIGSRFGGVGGGGGATGPPPPPGTNGHTAGLTLEPWRCPNPECGNVNHAPTGSTSAVCTRCKLYVNLTPEG